MRKLFKWRNVSVILSVYGIALLLFSLFRLILFITEIGRLGGDTGVADILFAFIMGIRFDLVITGYLLLIPFLVLSVLFISNRSSTIVNRILFYFVFISFMLAFFVSSADIPYFNQFFSRFSVTAFEWVNSPLFVVKMIVQEPR